MSATPAYLDSGAGANRIYDNVQAVMPGVLLPIVKMELWNIIEDFCMRSTYFRDTLQYTLGAGESCVDFNPYSENMSVCWIMGQAGLSSYHVDPPAILVDNNPPIIARAGSVRVALKPQQFSTDMPAALFDLWFETLLDGTKFRLFGQPAKPYSSPQLAQFHGATYRAGIRRARDQADRYNSSQQPSWQFPYFARGRRKQ